MPLAQIFDKNNKIIFSSSLYYLNLYAPSSGQLQLKTKRNGKYGIEDINGTIIIEHKYDDISDLIKGQTINYYQIENNGKIGFLKENGDVLIPAKYEKNDSTDEFNDGRVYLKKNGIYYAIDETGTELWNIKAERIYRFNNDIGDLIVINRGRYYGYIDRNGEERIECKYNDAYTFGSEGFALVNFRGNWGAIDTRGSYVIDPQFDSFRPASDCEFDRSINVLTPQKGKLYGILSPVLGKFNCDCKYKKVKPLSTEFIKVKLDKKWGLVDVFDNEILQNVYDEIFTSNELKKIFAKKGKKWVISNFDDPLTVCYFADEYLLRGNFLMVKLKGQFYLHLNDGPKSMPIENLLDLADDRIFYKNGELSGVMNFNAEILLETQYYKLKPAITSKPDKENKKYIFIELDGKFGVMNYNREVLLEPVYDNVWYFDGFIVYKIDSKYGYLYLQNNHDSTARYEKINVTEIDDSVYAICYSTDLDTIQSNYFLHIDKTNENCLLIFTLNKQVGNDIYLQALGPIGGGLYGDVYAKFHGTALLDISEGYFTSDLSFGTWEYYFKGDLCERTDESLTETDLEIFKRLSSEQLESFISYPDDDSEIPLINESIMVKLKKTDYISLGGTFIYKNLSKHWGLKYAW
jgi:hypothetical protein